MFFKKSVEPSILLGSYREGWREKKLALTGKDLLVHRHVIGLTGQGKSKSLASLAAQYISQEIPVGLVDPHADLASEVLAFLAAAGHLARGNLLYIDFSRRDYFLPFNVLRQPYDDHTVARNIVETVKRVWPALAEGAAPAFENILLHSSFVLIQAGRSLTDLPRFIRNRSFRDMLLATCTDQQVVDYWHEYFDRLPEKNRQEEVQSTLRRISLLTFSPTLRYSLGQSENVLNFRELMDSNTSVIFNLGGLDEDTQRFLGALITIGYEQAALSRAAPGSPRTPYHLILDEFSMFSAQSEAALNRILSLTRKYGLFLVMAHQSFSQVSERLQGALANTDRIAFRLSRADAEWMARQLASFDPYAIKEAEVRNGETVRNLASFIGVPETFEKLTGMFQNLERRQAIVQSGAWYRQIRTADVPDVSLDLSAIKDDYARLLMTPAEIVIPEVDAEEEIPKPGPPPAISRR